MEIPGSSLELLQGVADNRFGGDVGLLAQKLEKIEAELAKPGMKMFEKVGNGCLVFFSNTKAMKVCEENPDTIQGVIVNDFDCYLYPGATMVGSFLTGDVGSTTVVDSSSGVFYSNIIMSQVRRSYVSRSQVSIGDIESSTIEDSYTSCNLYAMHLAKSLARVCLPSEMKIEGQILDMEGSRPDIGGLAGHLLSQKGIRPLVHPEFSPSF